jgi:hypothetical protein
MELVSTRVRISEKKYYFFLERKVIHKIWWKLQCKFSRESRVEAGYVGHITSKEYCTKGMDGSCNSC